MLISELSFSMCWKPVLTILGVCDTAAAFSQDSTYYTHVNQPPPSKHHFLWLVSAVTLGIYPLLAQELVTFECLLSCVCYQTSHQLSEVTGSEGGAGSKGFLSIGLTKESSVSDTPRSFFLSVEFYACLFEFWIPPAGFGGSKWEFCLFSLFF